MGENKVSIQLMKLVTGEAKYLILQIVEYHNLRLLSSSRVLILFAENITMK